MSDKNKSSQLPPSEFIEKPIQTIPGEPWVDLAPGSALTEWNDENAIIYRQTTRQARKYEFFKIAFDFVADNRIPGDYHEYGCHRVRTFRMALTEARRHNLQGMKFHAFDSFAGLPEVTSDVSTPIWKQGALQTTEETFWEMVKEHGIFVDKIKSYKGFYDQVLTPNLQAKFQSEQQPIAFACVDCDLYESSVPVFKFLEGLLQEGTVLYLDDYYTGYRGSPVKGMAKAFAEYQAVSSWKFEPHLSIGWWGRSYLVYR